MATFRSDRGPHRGHGSAGGWGWGCPLVVVAVGAALGLAGCATPHPGPVSKLVNGRIVVSRAISPEAYEHALRAQLYEEEQRWADAALELQRALTFDGEGAELRAHLADLLLRLDRVDDAANQAAESLKTAPTVAGYLATAHVAEGRHDLQAAIGRYEEATRLARREEDPEAIEASHLALASAQMVALDVAAAHETVASLRDLDADSLQARIQLAALGWATGRLAEAEGALREALAIEPAEVEARLMLAALFVATGRAADAKAAFRESINRSEESTPLVEMYLKWLVARGDVAEAGNEADRFTPDTVDESTVETIMRIERASGRPARALAVATLALAHGTPAARVALQVAGALTDGRDFEGAARTLLQVGQGTAEFVDAHLRAAEVLRELGTPQALGRADRALDQIEAELARNLQTPLPSSTSSSVAPSKTAPGAGPEGATARAASDARAVGGTAETPSRKAGVGKEMAVARALLAEKRGDGIRAARILGAALETYPGDARLLMTRAGLEERLGNWRRALEYAEQILERDPRNVEALNFHGFVSADHGAHLDVTTRRLQIAVALDPGAGGIVDSLGWAYLQSGVLARAAELLMQADRLEPGDPEILSHLGDLYVRQQDPARAIATYRNALTHAPTDKLAQQIQTHLRELGAKQAAGR
jgi:tetratricopeptide (TPR) repeat protein